MVGTGLVGAAHRTRRRQVGCHPLDFFYDAEVALERESYAAESANTQCNTFAAIQGIAILPADQCLFGCNAVVRAGRRLAMVDLDPTVVRGYPGVVSIEP